MTGIRLRKAGLIDPGNRPVSVEITRDHLDQDWAEQTTTGPERPQKLFDITAVVGSVYSGGDEDPRVIAFELIARYGGEGPFMFPNPDGSITTVTVTTTRSDQQVNRAI